MIQNFDTQELAKFNALAAHWWDDQGELKTLHQINPIRLQYVKGKMDLKNSHIIDVGCGGGILSESLALAGAVVTAIDLNQSLIEVAKLHQIQTQANVEYICTAVESIAEERLFSYDAVTCFELLEHVPDPISIINSCAKLVKPGGSVFISTLNRNIKSYLLAILGAEYLLNLLPKNTHDYGKFIRPAELTNWSRKAGLRAKELKGIVYSPFSNQFSLSNDISVNYIYHAIKPL